MTASFSKPASPCLARKISPIPGPRDSRCTKSRVPAEHPGQGLILAAERPGR